METANCPHCRTLVQSAGGTVRCPRCGVRTRFAIMAQAPARPASTRIAAGFPAATNEIPQSPLERLLARLRRWRRVHDYPGGPGDEGACRRLGWLLMLLSLLPYLICAPLVLLFPAVVYLTFAHLGDEADATPRLLIAAVLAIVPLTLCAGMIWLRLKHRKRDDEGAPC
jgi:phage FluMu protein Com